MSKCPIKGPHDCGYSFEEHQHDIACQDGNVTRRTDDEVHKLEGLPQVEQDSLANIFHYQRQLMDVLGVPALDEKRDPLKTLPVNEFTKMLTRYSQDCVTAVTCESTELLDALPWKHWKKSYEKIDLNNVQIEIIDLLHFVLELAIIWGMDAKQVHELYIKKLRENLDRQKKGY